MKVASSPGHSHVFNVARRKEGRPGRRNHVSAIAQSLCTQSIEPYPNREKLCLKESAGVIFAHLASARLHLTSNTRDNVDRD